VHGVTLPIIILRHHSVQCAQEQAASSSIKQQHNSSSSSAAAFDTTSHFSDLHPGRDVAIFNFVFQGSNKTLIAPATTVLTL
jgi:hypothetical protein